MITLQELQDSTMPVVVPIGPDKSLTLHVFNQKGTLEHKNRLKKLLDESANLQQANKDKFLELHNERLKIQSEVLGLSDKRDALLKQAEAEATSPELLPGLQEQIASLDTEIATKDKEIREPLAEIAKKIDEVSVEGETSLHESYARQLEFFVSSMEIVNEKGEQIPPSFEFFRDRFAFNLQQQCVNAIARGLDGFLVQGSTGPS